MDLPTIDFKELIKELQRGETMQLVDTDKDIAGEPITNPMKESLEFLSRSFELFSHDLAPSNESKKFSELFQAIAKSIY